MQGQARPHRGARRTRTIPNTLDATTGTVATKVSIQTSAEGPPTGQQRLRPPINQTSHQMDARCMWIPGKIDMARGHKGGQLRGWLMLTERNVKKYYPEATKMAKGHLNQTQKTYAPPMNNLSHLKHATPLNSMARKYTIYTPKRTRYVKP